MVAIGHPSCVRPFPSPTAWARVPPPARALLAACLCKAAAGRPSAADALRDPLFPALAIGGDADARAAVRHWLATAPARAPGGAGDIVDLMLASDEARAAVLGAGVRLAAPTVASTDARPRAPRAGA